MVLPDSTAVVVQVVRGVLKGMKVLGGFPYTWDKSPLPTSPTPHGYDHTGNSANQENYKATGCWTLETSSSLCQQLCPKLRSTRAHLVWAAVMSLVYFVLAGFGLYTLLETSIPSKMTAGDTIDFIMLAATKIVLTFLTWTLS